MGLLCAAHARQMYFTSAAASLAWTPFVSDGAACETRAAQKGVRQDSLHPSEALLRLLDLAEPVDNAQVDAEVVLNGA